MNDNFSRLENSKRLIQWALLAQKLHFSDTKRNFKEREVWLASIGHGVGNEVFGKNESFERPVLVLRKFDNQKFLGVPFTTNQNYPDPFSVKTLFAEKEGVAMLDQVNTYDRKRLLKKMGMLDKPTFEFIRRLHA